jgi:hypothetical protein
MSYARISHLSTRLVILACLIVTLPGFAAEERIPVKVVVAVMFERGTVGYGHRFVLSESSGIKDLAASRITLRCTPCAPVRPYAVASIE